jgi:hypothetical protein
MLQRIFIFLFSFIVCSSVYGQENIHLSTQEPEAIVEAVARSTEAVAQKVALARVTRIAKETKP